MVDGHCDQVTLPKPQIEDFRGKPRKVISVNQNQDTGIETGLRQLLKTV